MSINLNFLSGTSNTLSIDEIMKCLGEAGGGTYEQNYLLIH